MAKVLQTPAEDLRPALDELVSAGLVELSGQDSPYWKWKDPAAAEAEVAAMGAEERRDLHRRLYDFIAAQGDSDSFAGLLAEHAGPAGLRAEAFRWNMRAGEISAAAGNFAGAARYYRRALDFAAEPGQEASTYLQLANLECHLGRFAAAEQPYREALARLNGETNPAAWLRAVQSLAAALVEQGRYAEALNELQKVRARIPDFGSGLERNVILLHLAQVYIGMGMMREADAALQEVGDMSAREEFASLAPYQQLLSGKLEVIQGRLAPAFRIFEEAARGFEIQGDLAGKLEVLLSISAPLMEHYLLKEAQALLDQLSSWEELKDFPALDHSVKLRRLSLGTFLGKWDPKDLDLLSQDSAEIGRVEDWLTFWFHLSLAARRLKESKSAETFLRKAKAVLDRISQGLEPGQRESFLRRPDIARILRLSERDLSQPVTPKVRARRSLPSSGPAEAATLAPPLTNPKK
ncbi:MAG TPA: tetratricopeptide repeat protein [bacterium]|nr:tetratricopeptide repeat protein [bacterium]